MCGCRGEQVAQPELSLRKAMSNAYPPPLDQLSLSASDDPETSGSGIDSDPDDDDDNGCSEDFSFDLFDY